MALGIFKGFSKPGGVQIASRSLSEAEISRLQAMEQVEYYTAIEQMYKDRIARLKRDIKAMTEESSTEEPV